jgi:hypothetical protein
MPRHEHTFAPGMFAARENRAYKRALNVWKQGDIVSGIGLFWATPDGEDPLTGIQGVRQPDDPLAVFVWDGQPAVETVSVDPPDWPAAMSIVISQTCDIAPAGPGERQPTVQVSPLERYDHLDKSVQNAIERGEYVDLFAVPHAPGPGKWMANLRISMPVSKSVLVGQTPISGFGTNEGLALGFSERIGAKFRRPALADALSGDMTTSLRELVSNARTAGEDWPDMIEQFRLEIVEGTRLEPSKVRILAVTLNKFDRDDKQALRAWRTAQDKTLRRNHNISLAAMRYAQLRELTVAEYRGAVQLRVPELGQSLMYY